MRIVALKGSALGSIGRDSLSIMLGEGGQIAVVPTTYWLLTVQYSDYLQRKGGIVDSNYAIGYDVP